MLGTVHGQVLRQHLTTHRAQIAQPSCAISVCPSRMQGFRSLTHACLTCLAENTSTETRLIRVFLRTHKETCILLCLGWHALALHCSSSTKCSLCARQRKAF